MSYLDLADPSDGTDLEPYVEVAAAISSPHCFFTVSDGEVAINVRLTRTQARNVAEMLGDWYRDES